MSNYINIKNEKKNIFRYGKHIVCKTMKSKMTAYEAPVGSYYYLRTRRRRLGEAKELLGGFNAHRSKSYSHRGCCSRYTTTLYT